MGGWLETEGYDSDGGGAVCLASAAPKLPFTHSVRRLAFTTAPRVQQVDQLPLTSSAFLHFNSLLIVSEIGSMLPKTGRRLLFS